MILKIYLTKLMPNRNMMSATRNATMIHQYVDLMMSYPAIGKKHDLSRQRVQQILKDEGVDPQDGGIFATRRKNALAKLASKAEMLDVACVKSYGVNVEEKQRIVAEALKISPDKNALSAYIFKKHSSLRRKYEFTLTLTQWWDCWASSGHWDAEDRLFGLSLMDSDKGYFVDNIEIIPRSQFMKRHGTLH